MPHRIDIYSISVAPTMDFIEPVSSATKNTESTSSGCSRSQWPYVLRPGITPAHNYQPGEGYSVVSRVGRLCEL